MDPQHAWKLWQEERKISVDLTYTASTALTSVRHLSLSWASPIQSTCPHPTFWTAILILSIHLRLGLPSDLLPSGFPTKTLYTLLSSPICATYPAHLILLTFITRRILGEEYKSFSSSLCNLLHSPVDVIISIYYFKTKLNICQYNVRKEYGKLYRYSHKSSTGTVCRNLRPFQDFAQTFGVGNTSLSFLTSSRCYLSNTNDECQLFLNKSICKKKIFMTLVLFISGTVSHSLQIL